MRSIAAREWVDGLQSADGGWAAFDADNAYHYLNNIPFADHGALLDPPTVDVAARCVSMLAQLGETPTKARRMKRGIERSCRFQETDGSWFGRWGMNYIYGAWSALCALHAVGQDRGRSRCVAPWTGSSESRTPTAGGARAADSYRLDYKGFERAASTASQTAWALLALMAAGEIGSSGGDARRRTTCGQAGAGRVLGGAVPHRRRGFPRVFYLRYHGYSKIFPLWALARFRNLKRRYNHGAKVGM